MGLGSIPGWGSKILQAAWHGQKERMKSNKKIYKKLFKNKLNLKKKEAKKEETSGEYKIRLCNCI